MVIRPLVAANVLGEMGRPASARGKSGGPAAFYTDGGEDSVVLGGKGGGSGVGGAKLYSASPLFKMMGAVQLTSDEFELPERPVLI